MALHTWHCSSLRSTDSCSQTPARLFLTICIQEPRRVMVFLLLKPANFVTGWRVMLHQLWAPRSLLSVPLVTSESALSVMPAILPTRQHRLTRCDLAPFQQLMRPFKHTAFYLVVLFCGCQLQMATCMLTLGLVCMGTFAVFASVCTHFSASHSGQTAQRVCCGGCSLGTARLTLTQLVALLHCMWSPEQPVVSCILYHMTLVDSCQKFHMSAAVQVIRALLRMRETA